MHYKIPDTPSIGSNVCELADYIELQCVAGGDEYSILTALKQISLPSDEIDGEEEDTLMNALEQSLGEIESRERSCNGRYPFVAKNNSVLMKEGFNENIHYKMYLYLLLSTRLNMKNKKNVDGIDGTLLFEKVSSLVAKQYFGEKSESIVFGTGAGNGWGFPEKVQDLTQKLGEGTGYRKPDDSTEDEKDGGLDIVVWRPFEDRKKGKLIGFGQCKTGTEWRHEVKELNPDDFCNTYLETAPYVNPIKLFFVAEQFVQNREKIVRDGGLFFDRCRIMEYLPEVIPTEIKVNILKWIMGNMEYVKYVYGFTNSK